MAVTVGGVISYAGGMDASEIAVLCLVDESAADAAGEALRAYLERCTGDGSALSDMNRTIWEAASNAIATFFVNRSAMCQGYSSTLQLFIDMLNIECITVCGIPNSNGTEHSWNMVRLDGEWYCVDMTWNDPIGGSPGPTVP